MARRRYFIYGLIIFLISSICGTNIVIAANAQQQELKSLDEQVQDIKTDVLSQTAELRRLEEKLLFPSNTQVSLFVSFHNQNANLESVELKLNNKVIAKYLYTFREQAALKRGGVQRIYTGNVKMGGHKLEIVVAGKTTDSEQFKTNAHYTLSKGVGPKFLEIKIADAGNINFQDW